MTTTCLYCQEPLRFRVGKGRPRTYCSTRCRVAAHRASALPAEMTSRDRWVRWDLVPRGERLTKAPLTAAGRAASSTNPDTWSAYAEAKASKVGAGIGFVLGAGIGCIDLDGALDERGRVAPWAQAILDDCPPTFIEVSQSGRGLHIFGLMPIGRGRNRRDGVEVYSVGRFIAMTGKRWGSSPASLADLSEVRSMLL